MKNTSRISLFFTSRYKGERQSSSKKFKLLMKKQRFIIFSVDPLTGERCECLHCFSPSYSLAGIFIPQVIFCREMFYVKFYFYKVYYDSRNMRADSLTGMTGITRRFENLILRCLKISKIAIFQKKITKIVWEEYTDLSRIIILNAWYMIICCILLRTWLIYYFCAFFDLEYSR